MCLSERFVTNIVGQEEYNKGGSAVIMGGAINLTALLSNASRECWLALNEEQSKIVGRGETIREAVEEGKKNGVDDPIVIWSPKVWMARVYMETK